MNTINMARKDKGFRLDTRIIEALAKIKNLTGKSANAYVEELLLLNLKSLGLVSASEEPLPETRGGKRLGSGKKSTTAIEADQDSPSEGETIV